jgi:hypothetical protein
VNITSKLAILSSALLFATSAMAGVIGTAGVNDVSLDGSAADGFKFSNNVNPQSGANGNTAGFASTFAGMGDGGAWSAIAKFTATADDGVQAWTPVNLPYSFTMSFDKLGTRNGTWTIKNNDMSKDIVLDLAFAMYSGNASAAWLFNNQTLAAGATLDGNWLMNLLSNTNNNNQNYSNSGNLTLFARDVIQTEAIVLPSTDVPAPATLALLLAGLGLMGVAMRRRSK